MNLLEEIWDRMDEEERDLIGNLEEIVVNGQEVFIPVAGGRLRSKASATERSSSGREERVGELLKGRMPQPMLEALEQLEVLGEHLVLRFKEGEVPELKDEGRIAVACHLY